MIPAGAEQTASTASAEAARWAFTTSYLACTSQNEAAGRTSGAAVDCNAQLPAIMLPVRYWDDFL